jgi:arylformamidase
MRARGGVLLIVLVLLGVLAAGAVLIHLHGTHAIAEHLHGAVHGAVHGVGADGPPGAESAVLDDASMRAREGVAAIGRRWDAAAFAETVALYTAVHRAIEWPGLLEPETVRYGADEQQTFVLFRPEQAFSEPGPVFVFVHGNGLGTSDRDAPGSDGLIYGHVGKLAATFGGIGVTMNYRNGPDATLESGARDLRLVIEWLEAHIAPYGGDPGTIVLVGNSEGATLAAAYLFNEEWQTAQGPGVAAAILTSGLFGDLEPGIAKLVYDYGGERVPIALWTAEYDPQPVADGIADLHELLCRKYDGCPWSERIDGHNHVSHIMSLGTSDESAAMSMIRFYHTVR